MSQSGKQIIAIHILPNISKGKGSQTMKFGQLIEYDTRSIFLEKLKNSFWNKIVSRETIPRPFSK